MAAAFAALAPAFAAGLVDHDGDGRISRVEYRESVAAIAAAADRNGDGLIAADEFPFTPADLALFDNNADGAVTSVAIQEFIDGMDLAFLVDTATLEPVAGVGVARVDLLQIAPAEIGPAHAAPQGTPGRDQEMPGIGVGGTAVQSSIHGGARVFQDTNNPNNAYSTDQPYAQPPGGYVELERRR